MKKLFFIILSAVLYMSCASSQNAEISREAEKKANKLKPLIALTDEQVAKMVVIETEYLKAKKNLTYSASYNQKLEQIEQKRKTQLREMLSRDQYTKLDLIENNRIKKVPIRSS